jgi:CDP-paratose 2-epimerase
MKKYALVTGSSGLIGSQSVKFFIEKGYNIIGIDNDMRSYFFGNSASTINTKKSLRTTYSEEFLSFDIDIRSYNDLETIFKLYNFEIIIHTAAQPSHDWAAKEPLTDFTVNALGTMNLLELTRLYSPNASFIFTSTNKVYGDRPNNLTIHEMETRYEYHVNGILPGSVDETMSIDNCKHSVFGASKVAADIMVQEYGRYFGMNTVVFRGGCLTGPDHSGVELHGFLSHLIKCIVNDKPYTIYGYKGKQVRDNIYSNDLVEMFWEYHKNPRSGEVYNAGGGRENSISIIEAIDQVNDILVKEGLTKWNNYTISEKAREGDHIWYITDYHKFKSHYPEWSIKTSLKDILKIITYKEINEKFCRI